MNECEWNQQISDRGVVIRLPHDMNEARIGDGSSVEYDDVMHKCEVGDHFSQARGMSPDVDSVIDDQCVSQRSAKRG